MCRRGKLSGEARVKVDTVEGSAEEGDDYIGIHQVFTFESGQEQLEIEVEIVDDDDWEPDEEFFLKLAVAPNDTNRDVKIGKTNIMTVMILNDDEPGTFGFDKRGHFVKESCGEAVLTVYREDGADGDIEVKYRTVNKTAKEGKDFVGVSEGILYFKHSETNKEIKIEIIDDMSASGSEEYFEVELYEVNCEGAKLGDISRTTVTIANDEEFQEILDNMLALTNANLSELSLYQSSWKKQLKDAMLVNGGNLEKATFSDYFMHFLTFGLKIMFASTPPPGKGTFFDINVQF